MLQSKCTKEAESSLICLAFKGHKNSNLRLHDLTDHVTDIQIAHVSRTRENYTKHLTGFDDSRQLFQASAFNIVSQLAQMSSLDAGKGQSLFVLTCLLDGSWSCMQWT